MLKRIHIIATGGTIAGIAASSVSSQYQIGSLEIEDWLRAVPYASEFADISSEQFVNVGSPDITLRDWISLAIRINSLLQSDDIDAIVVTHGTDTLEETAYFLNLVVKSSKPTVVVGSMRATNVIGSDGPINLLNAIAVAGSSDAIGKGVLVVMGGKIFAARDVTKLHTVDFQAFGAPFKGPIGYVHAEQVHFHAQALKPHTVQTPFYIDEKSVFSRIIILYEYLGVDQLLLKYLIDSEVTGLVFAGFGDGNIAKTERDLLESARKKGIFIVRSSRTGSGPVSYNGWMNLDDKLGLISSNDLNPQKARILLMLGLMHTKEMSLLAEFFRTY